MFFSLSLSSWFDIHEETNAENEQVNNTSVNNLSIYMIELTWDANEFELLSYVILSLRPKFSFRCRNISRMMFHSLSLAWPFSFSSTCKWSRDILDCPFPSLWSMRRKKVLTLIDRVERHSRWKEFCVIDLTLFPFLFFGDKKWPIVID